MIYAICLLGLLVAIWQELNEYRRLSLMARKLEAQDGES